MKKIIYPTKIVLWVIITVAFYKAGLEFSSVLRVYIFEAYCPIDLLHEAWSIHEPTGITDHVDWCDVSWWHSFRLLTRIFFGFIAGLLISVSAFLLLGKDRFFKKWWLYFVGAVGLTYISYFAFLAPFKDISQRICLWNHYDAIPAEECVQQLGSFGDQRFYYPLILVLTCWATRKIIEKRLTSNLKQT